MCECSVCMLSGTSIVVMSHCDVHHQRARRSLLYSPCGKIVLCCEETKREQFFVYYEVIKRELKRRPIYEFRYDERVKAKVEGSTRLVRVKS